MLECRLQIGNFATVGQSFDRLDGRILRLHCQQQAGTNNITIDADCARATYAVFAANMCAGQLEMLAEKIRQIEARQHIRFDALAIDTQRDRNRGCHTDTTAQRSGQASSEDAQRISRTFAKCRRMAGVACWSSSGSSSSCNAEAASANTAGVMAT